MKLWNCLITLPIFQLDWNQKEYRPFLKNYIEKYYENEY